MPGPQPPTAISILSQRVTLTDAEIKALPTTPIVIVPATETLDYSGLPVHLPVPVGFIVSLDSSAGAYTNVEGAAFYVLALGSDWSMNAMEADQNEMAGLQNAGRVIGAANSFKRELSGSFIAPLNVPAGALQDNALAIALQNTPAGNLTGGNAANSMKVTVLYTIIDV